MRPAEVHRLLRLRTRDQPVEEARREPIPATHAIDDVQLRRRRHIRLAVDPGDRRPAVVTRRVHLTQRRRDDLDVRVLRRHVADHREERTRVELVRGRHLWSGNAESELQVFLVADEHVHVLDDALDHGLRLRAAAPDVPELRAIVEVERRDRTCRVCRLHPLDDEFTRGVRQRREDAAAVKPLHATREDRVPVDVARLELRSGFVRAVVEHDGRADAMPAIAVDGPHVRPIHAIVLEPHIERLHTHRAHALRDEVTDGIVDHRADDAGLEPERIREVRRAVELAAAHVNRALGRLPKRNQARVEAMDEGAERYEIERGVLPQVQAVRHECASVGGVGHSVWKVPSLSSRRYVWAPK